MPMEEKTGCGGISEEMQLWVSFISGYLPFICENVEMGDIQRCRVSLASSWDMPQ